MFEDSLEYARMNLEAGKHEKSGPWYLDTARKWYMDLLPQAEQEKGRDHPVTLGIVASLVEIFYMQGDRKAAVDLMMERARGATA